MEPMACFCAIAVVPHLHGLQGAPLVGWAAVVEQGGRLEIDLGYRRAIVAFFYP